MGGGVNGDVVYDGRPKCWLFTHCWHARKERRKKAGCLAPNADFVMYAQYVCCRCPAKSRWYRMGRIVK